MPSTSEDNGPSNAQNLFYEAFWGPTRNGTTPQPGQSEGVSQPEGEGGHRVPPTDENCTPNAGNSNGVNGINGVNGNHQPNGH